MEKKKSYKVDRFELERQLAKSDQSRVFLARDTTLDRKVAVKFLPESFELDEMPQSRHVNKFYVDGDL